MILNKRQEGPTSYQECKRLWAAVLYTAVSDLASKNGDRAKALAWFASNDQDMGSFLWCCDILGLNEIAVREAVAGAQMKDCARQFAAMKVAQRKAEHEDPN